MATKTAEAGANSLKRLFPKWEVKDRTYVLTREATPVSFQLRSKHTDHRDLTYFDKEYGYERPMRYVTNQTSFFMDEQVDNYRLGEIVFLDGKLTVPASKVSLQQFLELHPDNRANQKNGGAGAFYEFDPDKAAREQLDREMKGVQAAAAALEMNFADLEAVARVLFAERVDNMTSGEIKRDVVMFAQRKPDEFYKVANNSNIKMRNLAAKAIKLGIIAIADDNVTVKWKANGREVVKLPFSNDPLETFAVWLKTEEGLKVMENLASKIE